MENQGNKTADTAEFGRICLALYLRSKPYKNQKAFLDGLFKTMEFETRGKEGKALSTWEMHDAEGNNCFPNMRSIFNVQVEVTNPDAPSREVGR